MLNANFGDVINNVNINQTGKQTKFNLSGRVEKWRYTVGYATGGEQEDALFDIDRANAKLEYLFNPQLIMRLERKDPVIFSSDRTLKISEFGIMYKFAF